MQLLSPVILLEDREEGLVRVTLLGTKAKVKDIAISREMITLKDVCQEGTLGRGLFSMGF